MENSIKEYEKVSKLVGTYIGWFERAIESTMAEVNKSQLGFWKKRSAKATLRKLSKMCSKNKSEFGALIDSLGALLPVMNEEDFAEQCLRVQRVIVPLYAKVQFSFKEMQKITKLVNFTRGHNARN